MRRLFGVGLFGLAVSWVIQRGLPVDSPWLLRVVAWALLMLVLLAVANSVADHEPRKGE